MSNKNSGSKASSETSGKGRPTPKRNAGNKKSKVQENRSANRQWLIIAAVLVAIVAAIFILTTVFGDPYEPLPSRFDGL